MRLAKPSIVTLLAVAALELGLSATAGASSSAPRTYTVLVGAENAHHGVDIMSYFPSRITIHVGDTVRWVQNSNEIHTVTFLGGAKIPPLIVPAVPGPPTDPSPLLFNPTAVDRANPSGTLGDTTTFVNSGLMGREPGQYRSFSLTFTAMGTYHYVCVVHGMMMSGRVTVVGPRAHVLSPFEVRILARFQIARQMAKAPAVISAAIRQIKPATENADGTTTHYVSIGFHRGQIDLMRFFPRTLFVRPGDRVVWTMSRSNDAPHTVTFLNGQPEPGLALPPTGVPPVLYINPDVLSKLQPTSDLMRSGIYSSGLMQPPGMPYSLTIGDVTPGQLPYLCLLHDTSGMKGTLMVLAK